MYVSSIVITFYIIVEVSWSWETMELGNQDSTLNSRTSVKYLLKEIKFPLNKIHFVSSFPWEVQLSLALKVFQFSY